MCVTVIVMFCTDPVIMGLSLFGAVAFFADIATPDMKKGMYWFILMALVIIILNPLLNHNGVTVLFVMNNNPVTLEAFFYGIGLAAMLIGIMIWFRSFTEIMTSDKILYVFGKVSPKFAFILSMTLRYIPLFGRQITKTRQSQQAMGLYKEDSIPDSLKGGMRIFSVMVTWALENGIITADSMTARGYGVGRRSRFAIFSFRKNDGILLGVMLALTAVVVAGIAMDRIGFQWYPYFRSPGITPLGICSYICYGILAIMPVVIDLVEGIRWKSLQSKI